LLLWEFLLLCFRFHCVLLMALIMHWIFSEWTFLFSMNNFCSYTFLLSLLFSVILSSLLCCSTLMKITVIFS
jgi:hypothetical protein